MNARYGGEQASNSQPGYNPLTDYEVAVGEDNAEYAEATDSVSAPSGRGLGSRPGYNPLTDYEVAVDGADEVDYAEAAGTTFTPSGRGLGRRDSTYNGFGDAADAEA